MHSSSSLVSRSRSFLMSMTGRPSDTGIVFCKITLSCKILADQNITMNAGDRAQEYLISCEHIHFALNHVLKCLCIACLSGVVIFATGRYMVRSSFTSQGRTRKRWRPGKNLTNEKFLHNLPLRRGRASTF